jgi:trehalose/maltose hydrolase-like predicted phosphorylase
VGDGTIATRGVAEEDPGGAAVLAAGTYIGTGSKQHLRHGPGWTALDLGEPPAADAVSLPTTPDPAATTPHRTPAGDAGAVTGSTGIPIVGQRRVLDLRSGVLLREELTGDVPLRTLRFASAARPGVQAMRAEGTVDRLQAGPALQPPAEGGVEMGREDGVAWARTVGDVGGIVAAAVQDVVDDGPRRVVERLAVYRGDPTRTPDVEEALEALSDAAQAGFDTLLAEHRQEWASRWATVDVEIPDDPAAQQAFRFAIFQLWSNVGCPVDASGRWDGSERAVGARGLSGQGYAGHVFWDADVFTLPAMATICPAAARAMLEYRIRRLPVARARAAADHRTGARFPWESARDGDEVTPTSGLLGTEMMQIRTGELEEHIVADVAWAADRYASWTGDDEVLTGAALPLLVETARYWASRVARSPDGRGHIDDVIGPDEYHEGVDDNAFTNIMARWNLRRGAEFTSDESEARYWREVADALVDGFDEGTRRHEQFAGYNNLEPLLVAGLAPLPFAADIVLGRGRVWRSQLIKQPDVLMAHFLVPGELPAGSLTADLDFYVPRTSHGSSLSPAITAGLLARAGRPDDGLDTLRLALRLDLDDLTGSSIGGLHLATIGGTWQALIDGFLGLSARDGVLHADPRLPSAWGSLRVRLRVLGACIAIHVTPRELTLTTDRPLRFRPSGSDAVVVAATVRFERTDDGWRLRP